MERKFKGVWIDKEIWENKDLSITEKCLLVEIDSLDNEKGCFAGNNYFADFFGISDRQIRKYLSKLQEKGYIKITIKGNKRVIEAEQKFLVGGTKVPSRGGTKVPTYNKMNNTSINNTSNTLKESKYTFEDFYNKYPKKTTKEKSKKKFKTLLSKHEKVMEGLERHLKYWKQKETDKQYIPNPLTWLNQERWEDELEIKEDKPKKDNTFYHF